MCQNMNKRKDCKMKETFLSIADNKILLPEYSLTELNKKKNQYLICIPVLNEGKKFKRQLQMMKKLHVDEIADVIICDGGSTDGSADLTMLSKYGVTALMIRKSKGHMSDQLMLGYYYALVNGYQGTITIDGNGKDGLQDIWKMAEALDHGYDFVQGSRYMKGGRAVNTPKIREIAIRFVHVPIVNILSGYRYTDTTNGFRAHNIRVFRDRRIQPFRYGTFPTYALIHYLTVKIPRLGYQVTEVPVLRKYPAKGKIPTKISPVKGNMDLIKILWNIAVKKYDPDVKL